MLLTQIAGPATNLVSLWVKGWGRRDERERESDAIFEQTARFEPKASGNYLPKPLNCVPNTNKRRMSLAWLTIATRRPGVPPPPKRNLPPSTDEKNNHLVHNRGLPLRSGELRVPPGRLHPRAEGPLAQRGRGTLRRRLTHEAAPAGLGPGASHHKGRSVGRSVGSRN